MRNIKFVVLIGAIGCGGSVASSTSGSSGKSTGATGSSGHASGSSGTSGTTSTHGTSSTTSTTGASFTLAFSPPSATITLDGTASQSAHFTLEKTSSAGTVSVSPESLQFDRPDLATATVGNPVVVSAPSPLGLFGGVGTLHAVVGGVEATAKVTVVVNEVDFGAGLHSTDASIAALQSSNLQDDPAAAIRPLLYPYDGTVWPLGLTSPPIMWNAPNANDVYRLNETQSNYSYDTYFTLPSSTGTYRIEQAVWDRITASNLGATQRDPLTLTLYRYDSQSDTAYKTATENWTIAPASLRGSIYYWTTSNGGVLSRIPPGAGATPQPITGPGGVSCMGCHAVSADGSTLVAAVSGQAASDSSDSRAWTAFDLPSATVRKASNLFAGNLAISPDGKWVISGSEHLKVSNSTSGIEFGDAGLASIMLDANMTGIATPAFSPDGTLLAAIEQGGNDWQYWDYTIAPDSELVTIGFNSTNVKFTNTPIRLADSSLFGSGENTINYPSFSPDSKRIAFQVADHNSGCWIYPDGCQNTTAEKGSIYLSSITPGSPPIRLARLSDCPAAGDSDLALEPTFNPSRRGGYDWLVFTSERGWGNDPHVQGAADNDKKRLWVSAIDPALADGGDPSHPAFFLEGQDATTQNMRGFWALSACIATPGDGELGGGGQPDGGPPCTNGFDCCSGFCNAGQCIGVNQVSCAGLGDACVQAADCCNPDTVSCIGGTCQIPLK